MHSGVAVRMHKRRNHSLDEPFLCRRGYTPREAAELGVPGALAKEVALVVGAAEVKEEVTEEAAMAR